MNRTTNRTFLLLFLCVHVLLSAQENPGRSSGLVLTASGAEEIRKHLGEVPLLDISLANVRSEVDAEMTQGIDVPIPRDMAGGYTHEQHKTNFFIAQKAAGLYQITGEKRYAEYVREMLLEYAELYPKLGLHPEERSYARGKLFWQALNDSNWLVYMSQAYAGIYDYLSESERTLLEKDLFRPFADFLSLGNPQFFNRIHNHSTWGNAAVGMIGLVMDDEELVQRALYGLRQDNIEEGAKDNDGGLIKKPGQEAGFLANIDEAFSPTGYYTEGPYYQRYAMYPFMIFAAALENKKPELEIFKYKEQVLIKAVFALLNLTDADGEFFPLNDAQKGMSIHSRELVTSVGLAFVHGGQDPSLLSVAKDQGRVKLDDTGLALALGIRDKKEKPFIKRSVELTDGPQGNMGGLAIIRSGQKPDLLSLLFKYTSQGNSHGHYDKLAYSLYRQGEEVIQDYGLARFVNIDQKNGGGYLKENTSWAKQSIAHNTVVQDQKSHFNGDFETGTKHHSERYFLDFDDRGFQIVSAMESNAYPGTKMHRTLALVNTTVSEHPLLIDVFRLEAEGEHQFDLPFYYQGQIIGLNHEVETPEIMEKLGSSNGYEHLWREGFGKSDKANSKFTWLDNNKFYTLTSITDPRDEIILARIGATDPQFNLRRDPAYILRKKAKGDVLFLSVLEAHGDYDPVTEMSTRAVSGIKEVKVELDKPAYTAIKITFEDDRSLLLIIANTTASETTEHSLKIGQQEINWTGPYYLKQFKD